jgi:hypothetical protein
MAQRPFITGVVALGIAATAMRLGNAPTSSQNVGANSSAPSAYIHKRGTLPAKTGPNNVKWTDEMKNNPEEAGRLTAAKELQEAIADFDVKLAVSFQGQPGKGGSTRKKSGSTSAAPDGDDVQVMIAIEPDPIHTHLSLLFDRDLDTLGDALQESGWEYETNWMPWSLEKAAAASGDHFLDREQQRLFLEGREQFPGVLLYRPRDRSRPKLEIFLVGNSPTGGINRTQFHEALHQLLLRAPHQTELKILGPTFSGSGPSLRSLLAEIPTVAPPVRPLALHVMNLKSIEIASGSVSAPDCDDFLPAGVTLKGDQTCSREIGGSVKVRVNFVSFAPDGMWVTQRVEEFLNRRGDIAYEQMAELTEDESSFGYIGMHPNGLPQDVTLKLTFPRSISHLRSAYQKSSIWGFGATTEGANSVNLSLDFDEPTGDDDDIPSFARQQLPVSQEGNLYQITSLLREKNIRVVILSATDVLDEIFVAQILARQAPNVLVIIWDTDDLFLRSGSDKVFRNMYFVSSWPLISENYFWSTPPNSTENPHAPEFRNFVSADAEGLHTAVHYLFPPPEGKGHLPDLPDYSSPINSPNETTSRPPLWLSSVGHGYYWPVALLGQVGDSREPLSFHQPPLLLFGVPAGLNAIERPPISQRFLIMSLCLLNFLHLIACYGHAPFQDMAGRYRLSNPSVRNPKLGLLLAISVLGMGMLALNFSPEQFQLTPFFLFPSLTFIAAAVLLSLAAADSVSKFFFVFFEGNLNKRNISDRALALLANLVIAGFFLGCFHFFWHFVWNVLPLAEPQSGIAAFFAYRVSHPLLGTSPVFPLFIALLGLVLYSYSHLGRLTFTDSTTPQLPINDAEIPNCPSREKVDSLTSLLYYPPSSQTRHSKVLGIACIVIGTLLVGFAVNVSPRLFEGGTLRFAINLVLFLLTVAILWDLTMASVLWLKLKTLLLEPLESSSLRRGFSAISGLTWNSFWLQQNLASQYSAIVRLLEQSSRLTLCVEAKDESALKSSSDELWRKVNQRSNEVLKAFKDVQREIARVADFLLKTLRQSWYVEVNRITAVDCPDVEEKSTHLAESPEPIKVTQLLREEWVALVYIHYGRMVLAQIRTRLIAAATLYLFLVWACNSYPFLNRHLLLIALAFMLAILSLVGISTYASINRDAILSRVTSHKPGELDLDFYLKTASLVGIPLIGFIASQFPEVSSFLFSWIEPIASR